MAASKTKKIVIEMAKVKDTKNFTAFAVPDDKKETAEAHNIYVSKVAAEGATKCTVTLELS